MLRRACSVALRMASGTSRALPEPKATRPLPSPTTTSAANPNRRPPFTTLATRLMETSFSMVSSSRPPSSRPRPRPSPRSRPPPPRPRPSPRPLRRGPEGGADGPAGVSVISAIPAHLKIKPAFAGGFGQGFDPAVIKITAAVEHHPLHAGGDRALGDQFSHFRCGGAVRAFRQLSLQLLVERGSGGERRTLGVVDHLDIDVLSRTEHGKPRTAPGVLPEVHAGAPLAANE